jgi:hypothetical protein
MKWQLHHAAARRGKRMALAVEAGRPFRGNPYDYRSAPKAHSAWASAYLSWRRRLYAPSANNSAVINPFGY